MMNIGMGNVLCDIIINKNSNTKCFHFIDKKFDPEGQCVFNGEYHEGRKTGKGIEILIK